MTTVSDNISTIKTELASTTADVVLTKSNQNMAVFIRVSKLETYRLEQKLFVAGKAVSSGWGTTKCYLKLYNGNQTVFDSTGTEEQEIYDELWRVVVLNLTAEAQLRAEISTMLAYTENVNVTIESIIS